MKQLWAGGEPRNAGPSLCSRARSGSSDTVGVIAAAMPLQGADIAAAACGLLLQSGSMLHARHRYCLPSDHVRLIMLPRC